MGVPPPVHDRDAHEVALPDELRRDGGEGAAADRPRVHGDAGTRGRGDAPTRAGPWSSTMVKTRSKRLAAPKAVAAGAPYRSGSNSGHPDPSSAAAGAAPPCWWTTGGAAVMTAITELISAMENGVSAKG